MVLVPPSTLQPCARHEFVDPRTFYSLSEVTEDLHRTLEKSGKYIQNSVQENLINTHELPGLQMGPNDRALVNFEFDEG